MNRSLKTALLGLALLCLFAAGFAFVARQFSSAVQEVDTIVNAPEPPAPAEERPRLTILREAPAKEGDYGKIVGEARNDSPFPLGYVQVSANFFDAAGVQIGSGMDNAVNLASGDVWRFEIDAPDKTASYRITEKIARR